MKKYVNVIMLLVVLLLGVAVAQDPWADVDPSGQTVTFWHQHSGAREEALQEIVANFNENNPYGITVVAENQGGYGDIFRQMLLLLGTPDVPDLVVAYQNQAATYQLGNGLVDMTSLVNSDMWGLAEDEQADFFPGFFRQDVFSTFDGARLGFPPNRSLEVMYYNSDWLEELGFDAPPATPDAFREVACAAAETPFSGAVAEGSNGYEISLDASRFASWTFAFGGDVFDYDTNRYSYDSPAAIAAMTFLQDLFNDGCGATVTGNRGDQANFGTGTLMFAIGSSSGLPFYASVVEEGADFAWSVDAIPHTTAEPVMNVYGASVSMPDSGSLERQLATWLWIKEFTSRDVQAEWALRSNYFPVRQSVAESSIIEEEFASNPAYASAFSLLTFASSEPPVPGYDFVRDRVAEAMATIFDTDADVEATLTALNEEANLILDEQLELIEN
jgi:multiple sugar transport system substrate-binding protein